MMVTFVHVKDLEIRFPHCDTPVPDWASHFRWAFRECTIQGVPPHLCVRARDIFGGELVVERESMAASSCPRHVIYQLVPDWHRANDTGLVRPGVEALWNRRRSK